MISPLRGHNNFDTIRNHLHRSQSSSPLSYHEREVGATASSIEISGRMITRDSAFTGFEREIIDLVKIIRIIGLRGEGDCTGVDWCAARFRIDYAGFWDGLERPGHAVCRLNCSFDAVLLSCPVAMCKRARMRNIRGVPLTLGLNASKRGRSCGNSLIQQRRIKGWVGYLGREPRNSLDAIE